MQKNTDHPEDTDRRLAAVCGLYCGACSWFLATREDPGWLRRLGAQFGYSEDESRCRGCRSDTRLPYCRQCGLSACAAKRGIEFCSQCEEYPCGELRQFQSAMPHRIELWANLERVASAGHGQWLEEIRRRYTCPRCGTVNSAYNLKCRACGREPSCAYVAEHRKTIEDYLRNRKTP